MLGRLQSRLEKWRLPFLNMLALYRKAVGQT